MAFRATTWGWKSIAARLLLVPVLAGVPAAAVHAQSGSAAKARLLTAQANQALQTGDLSAAERLAKQAVEQNAALAADEPKPENILREVTRRKSGGTTAAQGTAPAAAAGSGAKDILKSGRQLLAAGSLDQAQDAANRSNQAATAGGVKWGLFEDTPAALMKDVQEARGKADKVKSEQLFKDAKGLATRAARTEAEKMANLDAALNMAYQAKNLHGPYSMWDLGEKPDKFISDVEAAKAQLRKRMPAASATAAKSSLTPPAAPKTALASAMKPAAPGNVIPPPTLTANAASPAKAAVMQMVADGRAALAADKVMDARQCATAARKMAADAQLTAFATGEDSPDALFQAVQAKGRDMIAALTTDADAKMAAKDYAKADAAYTMAKNLSDGLGLYSKPIAEKQDVLAKLMPKPTAPMLPAAPPATLVVVAPTIAPPAMPTPPVMPVVAAVPANTLLTQAAAEMKRGDLQMARKMAIQAHADATSKDEASALLRQIDAEEVAVKRRDAKTALDNGVQAYAAKKYDHAMSVMKLVDPAMLTAEQQARRAAVMSECESATAGVTTAAAQVPVPAAPGAPGVARIGGDQPKPATTDSLTDQQKAMSDVAYQKLRQEGFDALNNANAAWGKGDTDAAIQALTEYATRVKASAQTPTRQAMLVRPVEARMDQYRIMKHTTDFLAKEATEKVAVRRDLLTANVAEAQKQDEIKKKVRQINDFTKAGKFKDAELAAAQAKQLDPDDPTLVLIAEQTKNRRRLEDFRTIGKDQEQFNLTVLNDAEKVGPPATSDNPLIVNPERARLAAMRGEDGFVRTRTQQETIIDQKLSAPFSYKFENSTLRDVIRDVRKQTGLNIVTDDAAIDDEKISLDAVTVSEEVKDLSLRDGLTILLEKARLAHVVENNVVKVTTQKRSKGRLTTKVFHVMDLVTPIPEFAPATHHRLDTAIAAGKGSFNMGAPANQGATPHVPPSGMNGGTMVSGGTGVPGAGGSSPFLPGGSLQNNLQGLPSAMSPQRATYSDQLKKLITGMVKPYAWQAMGGPGNIEYYDIGGALVVNQTADVIKDVQDLLESLRRLQDLSVAVEIRVISLSEAFFERVGVDFSMNVKTNNTTFERQLATSSFRPEPFLNDINSRGVTVGYNPAAGGFTPDLDIPIRSTSYALSAPAFGGYNGTLSPTLNGGLSLGLAFLNDIQVYMFLEAAQGNRRVNVMQAPKVTLFNGQTSTVFVGDLAYFTTSLQVFNVGGQFVYQPVNTPFPISNQPSPGGTGTTGVSVTVQAVISADRRFVRLNLSPTLTALGSATVPLFPITTFITPVFEGGSQGQPVPFTQFFQQPSFTEITVQTTVAVPDGGTVLMGGLKTLAQSRSEFGPPVLSHVPYLNRLFKNTGVGQETRHVMLMVTPRIIINTEEEARQVSEGGGLGGN